MTPQEKLAALAEVLPPKPLGDVSGYSFVLTPTHAAELHNRFNRLAASLSEQGEVVITTDASGRCVAVTRQDGEGRILSVIWEASEHGGGGEAWRPIDTAPRDGTMLRLLVQFDDHATEDCEGPAPTIGAWQGADGEDDDGEWLFAGWCWTHDHFTQGKGTPVGWLPMLDTTPPTPATGGEAVTIAAGKLRLVGRRMDSLCWNIASAFNAGTAGELAFPKEYRDAAVECYTAWREAEKAYEAAQRGTTPPTPSAPEVVYAVPTDDETWEHHATPPPNCDYEKLYRTPSAPVLSHATLLRIAGDYDEWGNTSMAAYLREVAAGVPSAPVGVDEAVQEACEDILHKLDSWSEAYPESAFGPVTEAERKEHGSLISRASASMGRHIARVIEGDIAKLRAALSGVSAPVVVRPSRDVAEIVVGAFLLRELGSEPSFTLSEDGEDGWAFSIADGDTTSYLHADLRVEWYGTRWESSAPVGVEGLVEILRATEAQIGQSVKEHRDNDPFVLVDPVTLIGWSGAVSKVAGILSQQPAAPSVEAATFKPTGEPQECDSMADAAQLAERTLWQDDAGVRWVPEACWQRALTDIQSLEQKLYPLTVEAAAGEADKMLQDALQHGTGVMRDGKHVPLDQFQAAAGEDGVYKVAREILAYAMDEGQCWNHALQHWVIPRDKLLDWSRRLAASGQGVECEHKRTEPRRTHVRCLDCESVKTDSDPSWGAARDRWFPSLPAARAAAAPTQEKAGG